MTITTVFWIAGGVIALILLMFLACLIDPSGRLADFFSDIVTAVLDGLLGD